MRTVRGVTQVIYYTWSILFQYCTSKLWCSLSHVWLFEAPGTAVQQALLSMEFSSQEYWCRLSFPPLGDLAEPGIEPTSPASLALAGRIFTTELPGMLFQTLYVLMLCYAKSLQSCLTLCDPIDGSPPGSAVPGILQVRTLEWVAISFSNAGKWKVKGKSLNRVQLFATPWTAAHQTSLSMGFSRQEYWSGLPLPSPIKVSMLWYSGDPTTV